jgi:ribosomal protein S12 methylthiotransferase
MKKIHITTLGCFKNQVDSDVLSGQLQNKDFQIIENPDEADVIILNTCGFIEDAKKESIDAIFEAVELKKNDSNKKVLVSGCLSQRYKSELKNEIKEIDGIFGTEDYKGILTALGKNDFQAENLYNIRNLSTPNHYAYLKISEGCNHKCSFCAIPLIRGKHKSRTIEDILQEAEILAKKGVKELILVSQDTSYYGKDNYGQQKIVELLVTLAGQNFFHWIRPLYWYPTNFPFEYIEKMSEYPALIPYLDMPIQHISNYVLKQMNRAETTESIIKLYNKIRDYHPEISLRTTIILGHPGETDSDFIELKNFIQDIKFNRLGTFVYSDEERTPAYHLNNKVEQSVGIERKNIIMEIQQEISKELNENLINSKQKVLIDRYDRENQCYVGRTYRDTPEIDNEVIIDSNDFNPKLIGNFVSIKINDASEYEIYGNLNSN